MFVKLLMYKTCKKCGVDKPHAEFSKDKYKKDGLRNSCKPCSNEQIKKWREKNPEYHKKYQEENREYYREYNKKWNKENKEHRLEYHKKWNKENKERKSGYNKKWYRDNLHLIKARDQKRRARKKAALPHLSENEKLALKLLAEEAVLLGPNWHLDHIVPISKGGLHHPDNLQIVKSSYNLSKSNKLWQTRKYT